MIFGIETFLISNHWQTQIILFYYFVNQTHKAMYLSNIFHVPVKQISSNVTFGIETFLISYHWET